jgi:hypothetical protein
MDLTPSPLPDSPDQVLESPLYLPLSTRGFFLSFSAFLFCKLKIRIIVNNIRSGVWRS